MNRLVVFGAGTLGKGLAARLRKTADVVVVDNDPGKWGEDALPPAKLKEIDFDAVYIAVGASSAAEKIREQLIGELGIPEYKILSFYANNCNDRSNFAERRRWLEPLSTYLRLHSVVGSVAEVGVLAGDFSHHLNRLFPDRTLYLFDTFEGYDPRDFAAEEAKNEVFADWRDKDVLAKTSVELVLSKLPYPDRAVIRKGYFPDTFNTPDERFCFVFLDLNLYNPIKAGLEIFYPLMSRGGIILIHDYFYGGQNGVSRAVDEFLEERSLFAVPAGDNTAIAIIKN